MIISTYSRPRYASFRTEGIKFGGFGITNEIILERN